jgi:hypothetical protein
MDDMNSDYFERDAIQIGGLARAILKDGVSGTVLGSTSMGLFLTTGQKILFLTSADYKSPFNIQIFSLNHLSDQIIVGDKWHFHQDRLIFSSANSGVSVDNTEIWQPSPLPKVESSLLVQQARMDALLQRILALDPGKGWLFLASQSDQAYESEANIILGLTSRFLECVNDSDLDGALKSGRSILGRGGGLTPSGDDWLSGFLLYHARMNNASAFIRDLGNALTVMAFESTTMISANRIEAACEGWSEEMFLKIIDSLLITDAEISDEKIERLVRFGHSSGVDTCVGIYAALKVIS